MTTLTYMPTEHVPVLAAELVAVLDPQPGELAVDCTFGGGGHAALVAERLGGDGTLICADRDPAAAERFEAFAAEVPCETRFVRGDFADALEELFAEGTRADVVYMDLGISSLQLDAWERGFSYAYDAPLDMRMDPDQPLSAREAVNEWSDRRLADVIRRFGEERHAGRIAREIVRRRPLTTTSELAEAVRAALPPAARFGRGHPAKRTFQAIRIAVNAELDSLDRGLPAAWRLLRDGGRFAAISFHSLEDRRVKRFLVDRARGCVCPPELPVCRCGRTPEAELLTRRAVAPSPDEIERNPRSASAHLRAAAKLRSEEEAG
ncbi:MAG TPA: 16S rRNA (cytosine(1402)-N(4))-methyltransferase RsmH [Solirubrobacterales bacterium]|jgi:16S rRNA (cytosine1402-N4)-methyltransferase|nr:16S rRNA (cytosine(1402)-N(4))-methyltransferase RsmH [Solirubrobacterales bacterium]